MKGVRMIFYVAEIVVSVPKEDGKRRLVSDVKVFNDFADAKAFLDFNETVSKFPDSERQLKIAKIYEIERIVERC